MFTIVMKKFVLLVTVKMRIFLPYGFAFLFEFAYIGRLLFYENTG